MPRLREGGSGSRLKVVAEEAGVLEAMRSEPWALEVAKVVAPCPRVPRARGAEARTTCSTEVVSGVY